MAQESEAVGMNWLPEMLDQALLTILLGTAFQKDLRRPLTLFIRYL